MEPTYLYHYQCSDTNVSLFKILKIENYEIMVQYLIQPGYDKSRKSPIFVSDKFPKLSGL